MNQNVLSLIRFYRLKPNGLAQPKHLASNIARQSIWLGPSRPNGLARPNTSDEPDWPFLSMFKTKNRGDNERAPNFPQRFHCQFTFDFKTLSIIDTDSWPTAVCRTAWSLRFIGRRKLDTVWQNKMLGIERDKVVLATTSVSEPGRLKDPMIASDIAAASQLVRIRRSRSVCLSVSMGVVDRMCAFNDAKAERSSGWKM